MNLTTSTSSSASRITFRRDVEGLRAIAVLLVLAYHAKLAFPGGFIGVDVFFVVSGFLITALLLKEAESGSISLRQFWARRVRRLLSASALVVAVTACAAWLMIEPSRLAGLAGDIMASATFSANIRFASTNGDYLAGLSLPSPLLHFWSLALEEQFYVFWPVVLALALKARRFKAVLATIIIGLLAASLFWSWYLTPVNPAAAYFLLPSRAWELLAGAGLALAWSRISTIPERLRATTGWIGLTTLVVIASVFGEETVFPGLAAGLPVLATLLVLIAGPARGPVSVLAWAPLQWIGKRSYALYLWHWPLLVLLEARFGELSTSSRIGVLVLTAVFADISFRLVEEPSRRNAWLAAVPRRSLLAGAVVSALVLSVGITLQVAAPSAAGNLEATAVSPENPDVAPVSSASLAIIPAPTAASPSPATPSTPTPGITSPTTSVTSLQTNALRPLGKVLLIGDSALAPLRWFKGATVSLQGFDWALDAESCRRLLLRSCRGREDRTPKSAAPVIDELTKAGRKYNTIVVMGGYHSTESSIGKEFDGLVASARRHGADQLVVLNFRESLAFPASGSKGRESVYGRFNDIIDARLATGKYPEVKVLDWNGFSAASKDWFRSDGIHVNLGGSLGLGVFISESLAALAGLPCGASAVCAGPAAPLRPQKLLERFAMSNTNTHCYELGSKRTASCRRDKLS
jgi:peptidoglycan/LPS O-acetylase OafA/YrhL